MQLAFSFLVTGSLKVDGTGYSASTAVFLLSQELAYIPVPLGSGILGAHF
jgi:hypothetical protein